MTALLVEKSTLTTYLKELQSQIIHAFESFEPTARFEKEAWNHHGGGGGEMAILRGDVFEKAAVNFSAVSGDVFPGRDGSGPFFATGVSLITHMKNPKMPTIHMNVRYIETEHEQWFGGGYDLTPMGFTYQEDTEHVHKTARKTLGEKLYKEFSTWAKKYYYIDHWNRERGVGGIFFDHYHTGDFDADLDMWKGVAESFLPAILPIYQKRQSESYSDADRKTQLHYRGQYAEFNLIYDRGTKFGFKSGGNPKAILCSMPPLASW